MSQLIFGAVPETYALAACSIITTYILFWICLQRKKLYFEYWILAGLFSFSVTITNFAQTLICFIALVFYLNRKIRWLTILEYLGVVVSFAFILSIIQKKLFPLARYFFMPSLITTESKHISTLVFEQPLLIAQEVFKSFFLVNFIAPDPFAANDPDFPGFLLLGYFMRPLDYSLIGYAGVILLMCLFSLGFLKNIIHYNIFLVAVCCAVVYNMILHSFFGVTEIFLYSCNVTFPVLLLFFNKSLLKNSYFKIGLVLAITLMTINNFSIIKQIISL
ncbi:hypothetical protein [Gloeocapsopsis dulcis]|nr:hypothetical protein [Gloeocapsopsis dulcis]WNN87190.1 hypothetical protein P0S91_12650 [Gloeocapsopsis dulcis]